MFLYLLTVLAVWLLYRWLKNKRTVGNYGDRYVVITGCDSGFGQMLAKNLDTLGFHVFACCLTEQGVNDMNSTSSIRLKAIMMDVSKTESIESAFFVIKSSLPKDTGLWGLVNNAGISGPLGPLEWLSKDDFLSVFEVNVLGMTETTRVFLPLVIKSKGRIVNMSSVNGRIATISGPYAASKYAVEGFSDLLRRELYKRKVSVHIIEPGCFQTNITNVERNCLSIERQYNKVNSEVKERYGEEYLTAYKERVRNDLELFGSYHVHFVVDAYRHALTSMCPKYRYIVGYDANFIFRLLWILPECISDFLICFQMPSPVEK